MRHRIVRPSRAVLCSIPLTLLSVLGTARAVDETLSDSMCQGALSGETTSITGPQGERQFLIPLSDGGMALCAPTDDGGLRVVIRAFTRLELVRGSQSSLTPWFSGQSVFRDDLAALIGGRLHRFSMLYVENSEAPSPVIYASAAGWATDLPDCPAQDMSAPLYRFGRARTDWTVEIGGTVYPLRPDELPPVFHVGDPIFRRIDGDDERDALVFFSDGAGTGPYKYLAVLLGCGDGAFAGIGHVVLGPLRLDNRFEDMIRIQDGQLYVEEFWEIPPWERGPESTPQPARRYHIHPESRGLRGTTCPADGCEPAPGT